MVVAAEPSGDALGAKLISALRRRLGEGVRFVGVGGAAMRAEGLQSPFDISELSILGWIEGLSAYGRVVARANQTADLAAHEKPDAAILIDSWGFTMRVGQRLRRLDPKLLLIKYVGPQVWASRPGRAKTLARTFDHLLSILAFDAPFFEKQGLPVTVVGHPTLAKPAHLADPERGRRLIGADREDPILLVLPGSRPAEIARLMGPFGEAVALLKQGRPRLQVALAVAPSVAHAVRRRASTWTYPPVLVEGEGPRLDVMRAATVALACSGTVSTELAVAGCPMVIAYRLGGLSYLLIRSMIKTRFITLLNVAAGRAVAPELIQKRCIGPNLARELAARLDDPRLRAQQIADQTAALALMGEQGGPDPSERAADAVIDLLKSRGAL